MVIFTGLIALCAIALALPLLSDLASLAVWFGRAPTQRPVSPFLPRFLVLIPAHNEELLIGDCLMSLRNLSYRQDAIDIRVIADNCSDATADLARGLGVRCFERNEPALAGKPQAIAWALERLPLKDVDALVILDADTIVDPGFLTALASAAPLSQKAVQGFNGVSNPDDSAITRMAAVFADAKCGFAYELKRHAGLNLPLRLGGCIGTGVLATHGWKAFSIGEDWELYAMLTAAGVPIEGVPGARVYAQEARALHQSAPQRRRWTAGRLTVLARCIGPLVRSGAINIHQKLDTIAELIAPGPVVHLGLALVLVGLTIALHVPAGNWLVALLFAGVARHFLYTLAAMTRQPHPLRSALAFTALPLYGLWRLGVEIGALGMLGDRPWIRTERHGHA